VIGLVDLDRVAKKLEEAYKEEKDKETEELHNAIVDLITSKKVTVQNAVFVLDMIKYELLKAKHEELFEKKPQ